MTDAPPPLPLRLADALSEAAGGLAALCALLVVLLMLALVLGRLVGIGSVKLQDAVLWLNAAMVMLGLGYALKHGRHVRIDAFAARYDVTVETVRTAEETIAFTLPRQLRDITEHGADKGGSEL